MTLPTSTGVISQTCRPNPYWTPMVISMDPAMAKICAMTVSITSTASSGTGCWVFHPTHLRGNDQCIIPLDLAQPKLCNQSQNGADNRN